MSYNDELGYINQWNDAKGLPREKTRTETYVDPDELARYNWNKQNGVPCEKPKERTRQVPNGW
jgi:hypothetical protein